MFGCLLHGIGDTLHACMKGFRFSRVRSGHVANTSEAASCHGRGAGPASAPHTRVLLWCGSTLQRYHASSRPPTRVIRVCCPPLTNNLCCYCLLCGHSASGLKSLLKCKSAVKKFFFAVKRKGLGLGLMRPPPKPTARSWRCFLLLLVMRPFGLGEKIMTQLRRGLRRLGG